MSCKPRSFFPRALQAKKLRKSCATSYGEAALVHTSSKRLPSSGDLKPAQVELWTGPTGTHVAEFFRCVDSTQQSVSAGQRKKFILTITSCKQVSDILKPRVYVADATKAYSVYAGPF